MADSLTKFDHEELRCPQLGGEVPFKYCRTMNDGLPCARVAACWAAREDVTDFLSANYPSEQLGEVSAPPGRLETIFNTLVRVNAERKSQ